MSGEALTLHLGELKDWSVKQFPVAMRQAVTAAADKRGLAVAEFMVRHFETHGIDGDLAPATRPVAEQSNPATLPPSALAELRELVTIAQTLSPPERESPIKRLAIAMIRDRLKQLRSQWLSKARIAGSVTDPQHGAPAIDLPPLAVERAPEPPLEIMDMVAEPGESTEAEADRLTKDRLRAVLDGDADVAADAGV